jgi:hypothetical protein
LYPLWSLIIPYCAPTISLGGPVCILLFAVPRRIPIAGERYFAMKSSGLIGSANQYQN